MGKSPFRPARCHLEGSIWCLPGDSSVVFEMVRGSVRKGLEDGDGPRVWGGGGLGDCVTFGVKRKGGSSRRLKSLSSLSSSPG